MRPRWALGAAVLAAVLVAALGFAAIVFSVHARVEPPHLEDAFRAVRGEFRLVPLPGGRTRLEGSTWYQLELFPVPYWRFVSDVVVQRIHRRVLDHIAVSSTGR